ncbi:glutathione S-transferase [Salmonella enterica]|nr:glutathione S-transferase [Salmonella enterica]
MITLWGRNNSANVKKVLWTLEELELPYDQILAGGKFGVNQDADYLAAQYGQNRLWVDNPARRAEGEKWMDWANQTLSPAHRVILMGLVRTPPEKRDRAAIEAGIEKCDSLFVLLDDALARQPWFSGDNFGTGDIAIAPFVYNLLNVGLKWTPRPNLERWYQQLTERPAFRKVVMIPVT